MTSTTPNLGLTKPDHGEVADVAVLNENFNKIDAFSGILPNPIGEPDERWLKVVDGSYVFTDTPEGEGGGGADPAADETITGQWTFTNKIIQNVGDRSVIIGSEVVNAADQAVAIGPWAQAVSKWNIVIGAFAGFQHSASSTGQVLVGAETGRGSSGRFQTAVGATGFRMASGNQQTGMGHGVGWNAAADYLTLFGYQAGRSSTGDHLVAIGGKAGDGNTEPDRLLIHSAVDSAESLTAALIDGRFRAGTGYRKGVKINGDLETTDELVVRSPNGTRWNLTVADDGTVSAVAATAP